MLFVFGFHFGNFFTFVIILLLWTFVFLFFFFSSRRRYTSCALLTGVQTCALPIATVFGGLLGRVGQRFYHRIAREGTLTRALIARLGLVERIALTPEGIPAERACRAVDIAIDLGLPVLNFSFHSPS